MNTCAIDGCNGKYKGLGYCTKHYQRFKKYKDPLIVFPKRVCSVEGCLKEFLAKGYCAFHYSRWKRNGDPLFIKNYPDQCTIDGCNRSYAQKGLCTLHYDRKRIHGDPLKTKYQRGYSSHLEYFERNYIVIENTECWEWTGPLRSGYGWMCVNGKAISAHRFSYSHFIEEIPEGMLCCHICDNRRCCSPKHLFIGTHTDNMKDMIQKGRHRWRKKHEE